MGIKNFILKVKNKGVNSYKLDLEKEKAILIFDSAILSGVTCLGFSIFSAFIEFYQSLVLTLVYAIAILGSTFFLFGKIPLHKLSRFHILLLFLLIIGLIAFSGGFSSPVLPWLITIPLTLLWLKNDRWVLLSLLIVIAIISFLYIIEMYGYTPDIYYRQKYFKLYTLVCNISLVFLVVSLCSNFDTEKSNAYKLIANQKVEIEKQNAQIKHTLGEKELLLKEIHHRVKNNLQIVSSLLGIQSRGIKDDKAKEAINEGRTRVHSMSLIHEDLYRKDNLTGVEMQNYLPKLAKDLLNAYSINDDRIQLKLDIQKIKLDVETVIPIGLVVNELVTNSLKYAFPNDRKGQISISIHELNDALQLRVLDDGIGLDALQLEKKEASFGHALIKAFKNKLNADIVIEGQDGTEVTLFIKNYKIIDSGK